MESKGVKVKSLNDGTFYCQVLKMSGKEQRGTDELKFDMVHIVLVWKETVEEQSWSYCDAEPQTSENDTFCMMKPWEKKN